MRLIDANALKRKVQKVATEAWKMRIKSSVETILNQFIDWIDAQPTITTESQWIPCSERLPEDKYVLISKKPSKISGDKWCVTIAIRTADPRSRKIQWRDSGFGVIQDDKVLAWMPLPEPYLGGDE